MAMGSASERERSGNVGPAYVEGPEDDEAPEDDEGADARVTEGSAPPGRDDARATTPLGPRRGAHAESHEATEPPEQDEVEDQRRRAG
jgi:hypothetical protein